MLANYFKSAFRLLVKEKLYTLINIIGLSIGLAGSFMMYSWVTSETNFDRFPERDRIFRLTTHWDNSTEQGIASTYPMMRSRVLSLFPEVEQSARIYNQGLLGTKTRITYKDKIFINNRMYYADSSFFRIFPFRLIAGQSLSLDKPNGVVITQSTAKKIFGTEDPVGEVITVGVDFPYEITAVMEDIPYNTHFHFDLVVPMQSHPWIRQAEENVWSGVVFHTYVKLRDGSSAESLQAKINTFMDNFPDDPQHIGKGYDFRLQPVGEIHLESDLKFELEENGNVYYVYLFSSIAAIVLLVAIINYTNLTTARHTQRLKEVGVRKILGAHKAQLINQFMMESFLVTVVALTLAMLLIQLAQPLMLSVAGAEHFRQPLWNAFTLLAGVGLSLILAIVTGIVPALFLASFKPVRLFKSNLGTFARGATLRKLLVISQFTVSIALTICTIIIYQQVSYIREANLGYDKEHTLVLNIGYNEVRKQYQTLKSLLLEHTSITGAAAVSQLPSDIQTGENIDVSPSQHLGVYCASVDPDFFDVMQVHVRNGKPLIQSILPSDSLNYFVLNEAALKQLGWTESEAINKNISIRHGNQKPGPVLGVIDNFHYQSFHHQIEPLVLEFNPRDFQYLLVKIKPERTAETIAFIGNIWKQVAGAIPFDFTFLDQEYNQLYRAENRSASLFIAFSIVALVVSLLGLFGLSSFAVEKRTREIGLRKVFGARIRNIMILTSKDFIGLLAISFLLAVPIGLYFIRSWLSEFVFRIDIEPTPFIIGGAANILFALIILSYHIVGISRTNAVDTLRYE